MIIVNPVNILCIPMFYCAIYYYFYLYINVVYVKKRYEIYYFFQLLESVLK